MRLDDIIAEDLWSRRETCYGSYSPCTFVLIRAIAKALSEFCHARAIIPRGKFKANGEKKEKEKKTKKREGGIPFIANRSIAIIATKR